MKDTSERVALVDVAPDGVRLILIDHAEAFIDFGKIFARVDAHECAGRAILLTGIALRTRARRVERRPFAEITFRRE